MHGDGVSFFSCIVLARGSWVCTLLEREGVIVDTPECSD